VPTAKVRSAAPKAGSFPISTASFRLGKKIEKVLANLSSRKKITKRAHTGRGREIN
jgi:hypothetical protein